MCFEQSAVNIAVSKREVLLSEKIDSGGYTCHFRSVLYPKVETIIKC